MIKKIYRGEPGGAVKVTLPSGKSRPLRHVELRCIAKPDSVGDMAAQDRQTWH
jgi:hypothetical protein